MGVDEPVGTKSIGKLFPEFLAYKRISLVKLPEQIGMQGTTGTLQWVNIITTNIL